MGKRSNFDRVPRDFYPTPREAVLPLLPHLPDRTEYIEPCAGDGALVRHLGEFGHRCIRESDIEPQSDCVSRRDALASPLPMFNASAFITNPPWDRKILHPLIDNLSRFAPTWLLFDADWMHTKQSAPFMEYCAAIVSVGRIKWIPDSKMTGKDNCAWYLFDKRHTGPTRIFGRATAPTPQKADTGSTTQHKATQRAGNWWV